MKSLTKRLVVWTPRILGVVFALFISLFALDVFEEGRGLGQTILALIMHLIPTALVLVALVLAWRWEWLGGLLFVGLGVCYLLTSSARLHWSAYALIAGPLFLLGALFLANWFYRAQLYDRN